MLFHPQVSFRSGRGQDRSFLDFRQAIHHVEKGFGKVVSISRQHLIEIRIVVVKSTNFPGVPVNISAMKKGCDKN